MMSGRVKATMSEREYFEDLQDRLDALHELVRYPLRQVWDDAVSFCLSRIHPEFGLHTGIRAAANEERDRRFPQPTCSCCLCAPEATNGPRPAR